MRVLCQELRGVGGCLLEPLWLFPGEALHPQKEEMELDQVC